MITRFMCFGHKAAILSVVVPFWVNWQDAIKVMCKKVMEFYLLKMLPRARCSRAVRLPWLLMRSASSLYATWRCASMLITWQQRSHRQSRSPYS